MSEFEDRLNHILSSPEEMEKISIYLREQEQALAEYYETTKKRGK